MPISVCDPVAFDHGSEAIPFHFRHLSIGNDGETIVHPVAKGVPHLPFLKDAEWRRDADAAVKDVFYGRHIGAVSAAADDGKVIRLTDRSADGMQRIFQTAFGRMLRPAMKTPLTRRVSSVGGENYIKSFFKQSIKICAEIVDDNIRFDRKPPFCLFSLYTHSKFFSIFF